MIGRLQSYDVEMVPQQVLHMLVMNTEVVEANLQAFNMQDQRRNIQTSKEATLHQQDMPTPRSRQRDKATTRRRRRIMVKTGLKTGHTPALQKVATTTIILRLLDIAMMGPRRPTLIGKTTEATSHILRRQKATMITVVSHTPRRLEKPAMTRPRHLAIGKIMATIGPILAHLKVASTRVPTSPQKDVIVR